MPEPCVTLSLEEVLALGTRCLAANGCDTENAAAIASVMQRAERDGCQSHGLFRLPGYVASLRSGKVDGRARPTIARMAPAVLRADGGGGYAPLVLEVGIPQLAELAREGGIAALVLVRVHHFAALWPEVDSLVEAGLVGLAFVASKAAVAPAGATAAFFGTNPLAFGWPRPQEQSMVFDLATSATARGELLIAARDGHDAPPAAGLDSQGNSTTDARAIIDGGVQLPFGGYKGSALSMMVELLSAGLIGEDFGWEAAVNDLPDGGPARGGELVVAMDPNRFGNGGDWSRHAEEFFARLSTLDGVRLPADRRRAQRRVNAERGVRIPVTLHDEIVALMP